MLPHMRTLRFLLLAVLTAALWSCGETGNDGSRASTLNRGLAADPESLDPHKMRSVQAGDVLRDIGEGLASYSASGELVTGAATSWSVSEDGLAYTFKIRPAARWSNGDSVTAEHFAYSLRRLVDPATASFNAHLIAEVTNARAIAAGEMPASTLGVAAIDEHTLVISLSQPTPYFLALLTYPSTFPVHPDAIAEHGDAFTRPGALLSNGAYKLDAWEPGSVLKLSRNEYYWNNPETTIDVVNHLVIVQEVAELNRYRAGEIHFTSAIPPDSFQQLRDERPDEMHISPYLGVYYFGLNLSKPPFKDNPQLRRALSMAIDRDVLVEKITGRGEAAAYSWVPPGINNYEPRRFSYAEQSQDERNAQARRLMLEAGYGAENPLRFELRYNTSDTHKRIALAAQAMWREALGVETTLVNEELQVLLTNMREAEVTQVFRSSWIGDYNDAHTFLSILQAGNPSNTPLYASDEYDDLMRRAAKQIDPMRRRLYLEEAERILLTDHPVIPLYFYVSKHLVSPEVRGWGDNVLDYHYSQHLSLALNDATR